MGDIWSKWRDRGRFIGAGIPDFTFRHYMDIELDADRAARNIAFGLACVACWHAAEASVALDLPYKQTLRLAGLWKERT